MGADQLDLFGGEITTPSPVRPAIGYGGSPGPVVQLLGEVTEGRFGVLDVTDRVVVITDERCRYAANQDAAVIESLLTQRYLARGDLVICRHGVISKRVLVLKLTPGGHKLRALWASLR